MPSSAEEAAAALEQEANMKTKLIESAKQSLREAIATAKSTRESPPLADHLAKQIHTDDVLRDSCADMSKEAEALWKELVREQREKVLWIRWEGHARAIATHPLVMIYTFILNMIGIATIFL